MTYEPEEYWRDRFERQGVSYVAKGGRADSYYNQLSYIAPFFSHLPDHGRVLDFGCGPRRFQAALEARGLAYDGVDLIPGLGTLRPSELPSSEFRAAVAIFVLQHIIDIHEYWRWIREVRDVLKPGGVFLVVDHMEMEEPAAHMSPRGPDPIISLGWEDFKRLGDYNGHWIGLFRK